MAWNRVSSTRSAAGLCLIVVGIVLTGLFLSGAVTGPGTLEVPWGQEENETADSSLSSSDVETDIDDDQDSDQRTIDDLMDGLESDDAEETSADESESSLDGTEDDPDSPPEDTEDGPGTSLEENEDQPDSPPETTEDDSDSPSEPIQAQPDSTPEDTEDDSDSPSEPTDGEPTTPSEGTDDDPEAPPEASDDEPSTASDENDDEPEASSEESEREDEDSPAESSFEVQLEQEIHEEVNDIRAEHGLAPLEANERLAGIARGHSEDMAERDFFSHTTPDGTTVGDRYDDADVSCRAWGENILYSYGLDQSPEAAAEQSVTQWMNSEGHRENILGDRWDSQGIGVATSDDGRLYVTQNFATACD